MVAISIYPQEICASSRSQIGCWIVVRCSDPPDLGQPIGIVGIGGALEGVGQRPGLALVGPVLRLERVRLPEPRHSVAPPSLPLQPLAELKAGRGAGVFLGPWTRAGEHLLRWERVA